MFIKTSVDLFILELQDELTVLLLLLLLLLLYPLQFISIFCKILYMVSVCIVIKNQNSRVIIIVCSLIYILFSFN